MEVWNIQVHIFIIIIIINNNNNNNTSISDYTVKNIFLTKPRILTAVFVCVFVCLFYIYSNKFMESWTKQR